MSFVTTRCSMCWPASSRPSVRTVRRWPARARSTGWSTGRGARPGSITRSITMRRAWKHCCGHLPQWPQASAEGDRARPRRHRRHDPRRARRSVLPWLLRQLLLPAALHLLRPVPARRQAAPRQHRRGRRRGRRGRPDRRPHPGPLAEGADRAARRFGLLPRGTDGVVARPRVSLTCSAWRPTRA